MDNKQFSKNELKSLCRKYGLRVGGNRPDLIDRIVIYEEKLDDESDSREQDAELASN